MAERAHPQAGIDLNLTYIQQTGDTGSLPGGDKYTGLDRFGRVVDQRWRKSGVETDRFKYGYDRNSNRTYRENLVNGLFSELYHTDGAGEYDKLNQLTNYSRGQLNAAKDAIFSDLSANKTWALDPLGNWTNVTGESGNRGHNSQNQLTSVNGATLAYDKNGNVNKDQSGKTLLHDAWNRLLRVRDNAGKVLLSYSYDALGRRLTRTQEDVPTTPVPVHLYYSADWQLLQERVNNVLTTEYVWSPVYVDAMILRDRDLNSDGVTTDAADERLYVQQDANWNVTAVVGPSGVQERYVYDPYGQVSVYNATLNGSSIYALNWVYYHQGGRFDSTTGLYHFRIRDYSPTLGRWVEQDPIGLGADSNSYRYEGNSPSTYSDPGGLLVPAPVVAPVVVGPGVLIPPAGGLGGAILINTGFYQQLGNGSPYWQPTQVAVPRPLRLPGPNTGRLDNSLPRPMTQPKNDVCAIPFGVQVGINDPELKRSFGDECKKLPRGYQKHEWGNFTTGAPASKFDPRTDRLMRAEAKVDNWTVWPDLVRGTDTTGPSRTWVAAIGRPGDVAGHAIAQQFGGKGGKTSGNIVPLNATTNHPQMSQLENRLAALARADRENTHICISLGFDYGNSQLPQRPTDIFYRYTVVIGKEVSVGWATFPNP